MAVPMERRNGAKGTGRTNWTVYASSAVTVIGASRQPPLSSSGKRKVNVGRLLAGMSSFVDDPVEGEVHVLGREALPVVPG